MFLNPDIQKAHFRDINVRDSFFDSLRDSYVGFDEWFMRKQNEMAYVMYGRNGIQAFLYLKIEHGAVNDIRPPLNTNTCLKIGTFKINAHGTKLGERFVKKIFDHAIVNNISHIYVTVFPEQRPLISILEKYGFNEYGVKCTNSGNELVFLKDLNRLSGNSEADYPVVDTANSTIWIMSIYPEWHTKLFPDSILRTERASIVEDVSCTNSIHKVYIGWMKGMESIQSGDMIIIYRAVGRSGRPWFESVITSICVVADVQNIGHFRSKESFVGYAGKYSVFSEQELANFYQTKKHGHVIRMLYNIALPKRLNMKTLVEEVGLEREEYWGFRRVASEQFKRIVTLCNIPSCCIV